MKVGLRLAVYVLVTILVGYALLPLTWLVLAAFDEAATLSTKLPSKPTFENFVRTFTGLPVVWTLNSLIIASLTATLALMISVFAAYPLSRLSIPGKDALLYGFVLLRIIPVSTFMVPLYLAFASIGLINTHIGVILALTFLSLPFTLLVTKGFYDTLPTDIEEAAWLDGASRVRTLFTVLMPVAKPGMAVAWFMTFMAAWNEFLIPLIFFREIELFPLSVGLWSYHGVYGKVEYGLIASTSILYAIPAIAIYIVTRKYLVKGMVGYTKF